MKKHKYSFEDRNAFLFCYIILGIPLLFFLIFWLYVNAQSILLAFKGDEGGFSLEQFRKVFKYFNSPDPWTGQKLSAILGRTVLLWFMVDIVCVFPSMFSSYVLYKKIWGAPIFRVILMVPTILAGIIWVYIMRNMADLNGPIMTILDKMGVDFSLDVLDSGGLLGSKRTAFLTIVLFNMFPHIISLNLIVSGAYSKIPADLFEVGRLEGLNFVKEFFIVSVPLIWPTVVISLITNLAVMFTFDGNVFLYTNGAADTATSGFYLYRLTLNLVGAGDGNRNYGYVSAVGVMLTAITIPVVLFGKYFLERLVEPVEF